MHSIRDIDVVVANFEGKEKVVFDCVRETLPSRTIYLLCGASLRRDVVGFFPRRAASFNDAPEHSLVPAVCPHAPFGIWTGRHVGLYLLGSFGLAGRLDAILLAFD